MVITTEWSVTLSFVAISLKCGLLGKRVMVQSPYMILGWQRETEYGSDMGTRQWATSLACSAHECFAPHCLEPGPRGGAAPKTLSCPSQEIP